MKIVFFGTSNVALPVLEALNQQHQIAAVVTAPDAKAGRAQGLMKSPVAMLAEELKLPLLKPDAVKNNPELLQQLRDFKADIFIVVSYGKILPPELIDAPPLKTLNVHFSLLPKFRGAAPIQAALRRGKSQTGTTIFVLDPDLDHGPIVAQEPSVIEADDNFITLSQRLAHQSAKLLINTLPDYAAGLIQPRPQDHSQATSARTISKADGKINWQNDTAQIYNQFRAFYPWPGVWTTWNGQILKILDCVPINGSANDAAPGTVLADGSVAAGNNTALKIKKLQLAGKRETTINDFLNGYRDFIGSKLG